MQGMTSTRFEEQEALLHLLEKTDAGTGFMHEGFHVDNSDEFTRPWFSWANMMFCELVLMRCGKQIKRG